MFNPERPQFEKGPEPEEAPEEEVKEEKLPKEEPKIEIVEEIGHKLSEKEIEERRRIREEIEREKEIREKQKRGELLSSRELAMIGKTELERKWKAKAEEAPFPEEAPRVKVEEEREEISPEIRLEESRGVYVEAYNTYRKAFSGMKEKKLEEFEKTVEPARKYIEVGDKERLKSEEKEVREEAEKRKNSFIGELTERGMTKERAEAIYKAELTKAEYEEVKLELGKKLEQEGIEKGEIFKRLVVQERELLNQAKIESWPPKEKNIFRKGMEWWMKRGTATRLLISTGLVTGVVATVGGFSASAVAMFAGYRFVRGAGSVLAAKLAGKGIDWKMSKGIEARHEASLAKLKEGFDLKNLKQAEKELEKIFEERAKRERRKLLIKGVAMAGVGAGTAIGLGMLEHQWAGLRVKAPVEPEVPSKPEGVIPPVEAPAEIRPEVLIIGNRGPEGAIIDHFKGNSEIAKSFGWDSKTDLSEWAGRKAHLLWLEDAKEALAKPETLEQLKKLGYSPDPDGYAQMMRRIGKGFVEVDPKTGEINLVDAGYLKAKLPPIEHVPGEEVPPSEPIPGEEVPPTEPVPGEEAIVPPSEPIPGEEVPPTEPVPGEEAIKVGPKTEAIPAEETQRVEKFEVKSEELPGGVRKEEVIMSEHQFGMTGRENLNMEKVEELVNSRKIGNLDLITLKIQSQVFSAYLNQLEKLDPASEQAKIVKNAIRNTVRMYEKKYSKGIFSPEIYEIIKGE